ncbi:SH3 domain-containing protein [Streptomyces sp. NPDC049627]|uniref:SH3 domain-containing protein n=1 Tax=Streptomyces sp. NPDC049627 TaxID=3365595 RepID=UPI0037BACA17
MTLRSRIPISLAAGAVAVAAFATPAVADDEWGQGGDHDRQFTRGVVTASTLLLRSAPNRGSQVIRVAHEGDVVRIFCQWFGESVQGNNRWYLLADGTWAWGSARFIETTRSPRLC